jgi:hypothetical protein
MESLDHIPRHDEPSNNTYSLRVSLRQRRMLHEHVPELPKRIQYTSYSELKETYLQRRTQVCYHQTNTWYHQYGRIGIESQHTHQHSYLRGRGRPMVQPGSNK